MPSLSKSPPRIKRRSDSGAEDDGDFAPRIKKTKTAVESVFANLFTEKQRQSFIDEELTSFESNKEYYRKRARDAWDQLLQIGTQVFLSLQSGIIEKDSPLLKMIADKQNVIISEASDRYRDRTIHKSIYSLKFDLYSQTLVQLQQFFHCRESEMELKVLFDASEKSLPFDHVWGACENHFEPSTLGPSRHCTTNFIQWLLERRAQHFAAE